MRKVSVSKVPQKIGGKFTGNYTSWCYRFSKAELKPDGSRVFAYKAGFKTKKEAEAAGWEAFNIEYGIVTDPMQQFKAKYSKMPFEDYVMKHWFEENKSMWKSTTETGYMKKLRNHIFPTFARRTLGQISSANLQEFFNDIYLHTKLAITTADNLRALMSQIFKYAADNGHILSNPMLKVKKPNLRIESSTEKNYQVRDCLPDDVIEKIFVRFPKGSSAYIPLKICVCAGLRLSEALGLSWDDISFKTHCIYVRRQLQRRTPNQRLSDKEKATIDENTELSSFKWYTTNPKYESKRIIPMTEELEKILLEEKKKQKKNRHILEGFYPDYFYTKTSKPNNTTDFDAFNKQKRNIDYENGIVNTNGIGYKIDFVNRHDDGFLITESTLKHAARVIHGKTGEAPICEYFNVHSLRHTFASKLREQGCPEYIVQDVLGHKSQRETQVYMHTDKNEFFSFASRLTSKMTSAKETAEMILKSGFSKKELDYIISKMTEK